MNTNKLISANDVCEYWAGTFKKVFGSRRVSPATVARKALTLRLSHDNRLEALDWALIKHFATFTATTVSIFPLTDAIMKKKSKNRLTLLNRILRSPSLERARNRYGDNA